MDVKTFNLVDTLLFPTPEPSYGIDDFPGELIWIPKKLDPVDASPEDCVPCLLLSSPSSRFFILYLHSNAEDLGRCYAFCSLLRYQFQVHVLAVEYPGYGICPGRQADEESVIANAFVAFDFVHQVINWPLDGIMIFGRSIGCGPALAIAAKHDVYGVILVCPFLSVRELCRDFVGSLAHLIEDRFPNKDMVQLLTSPLLLVHGKKDTVVPWSHGRMLYEACRTRKRLVTPEEMHHNTNLVSDATFLVLPMLQFFCLPDYDFDDVKVPAWVFDKRLSPSYHQKQRDSTAFGSCPSADGGTFNKARPPGPAPELAPRSLGAPSSTPTSCSATPQPDAQLVGASLGSVGVPEGADSSPQLDAASDSEGSTVNSEEVVAVAVQRFIQIKGFDTVRPLSPFSKDKPRTSPVASQSEAKPSTLLEQLASEPEELPEPPDDKGFFKVPRTRAGGPQLLPMPEAAGAPTAGSTDWSLRGWITPPRRREIQQI
uniref:Serine aminopeptidase S33 domain-containing protein n=1 Tax=Pyrodinium bahamense TaxID=73915 RepID=A0A7R9ZWI2_9DINO|mmetsp:Transcript_12798/g.35403  ORF Transcript_12798/g.35403 Transcript_12798/m.35403 type:complete len:485 (+) Transcript_12798:260-1714(+)